MKLTAERLIHAISNQIDSYTSEDALNILRDEYGFDDDEIREMGFDYLFPEEEEPNEPPAPVYDYAFVYRQTWSGVFHVHAHSREEAYKLWEEEMDAGLNTCALDQLDDDGWDLLSVT